MIVANIPDTQLDALAARAQAALPVAVNGRIEKAVRLVRSASVELHADGSATVISEQDGLTGYLVQGKHCTCPDFQFQAPEGYCAHRIAVALAKRCQQGAQNAQEPSQAADVSTVAPDPEVSTLAAVDAPEAHPGQAPLPEAPASANVRVQVAGREVQITLRDTDEARLLTRLEALLQRFPVAEAQAQAQPPPEEKRYCPKHGMEMKHNQKEGRTWWSHRLPDGAYCKGK